jgi:hypothetical protein
LFAFSGNFLIERHVNTQKDKARRLEKLSQRLSSRSLILMLFNAVTGRQISRSLALELLAAYLSAPQEAS